MAVIKWDSKKIRTVKSILKKHCTVNDALPEIAAALKAPTSENSIDKALHRAGEGRAASHLKAPELHPIAKQEMREQTSAERRQIEQLTRELRESNERQDFIDATNHSGAPPQIIQRERSSGLLEMTPVVLASDWHVEETVDPESIAYRNKFNLEIADRRIKRFFEAIMALVEHHRASGMIAIHSLVCWLGGDLFSGYIHEELMKSNELSPIETILWLKPRLRDGLFSLVKHLDIELVVPCSIGNHGRTTKKMEVSTSCQNSYEWLMYHQLADDLRGEKQIRFEITRSDHQYVQTYDRVLHFHHGHSVKYQGGVGGLGIPLLKAVPVWDEIRRADVHNIGHWHQLRDYGRAVVNGSLIGYNAYAQHIRAAFEAAQQTYYMIDSKRGKCMHTPLWVDNDTQHLEQPLITAVGR